MRAVAAATLRQLPRASSLIVRPALALPPQIRRGLVIALGAAVVVAGGYQFWFRNSSLVAVDHVKITGLTTREAPEVRAALTAVARDMTTLNVRVEELEDAVASYGVVHEVRATADFPHTLRIEVQEQRPAAVLETSGGRVAVAGDGTLLRDLPLNRRLPAVSVGSGGLGAERLTERRALEAVAALATAPAALRPRLEEAARERRRGLVVRMRRGPDVILGDASRLREKWMAATRVMASPSAAGASYVDVRLPERPAAGGLAAKTVAPLAPAGAEAVAPPEAPVAGAPAQQNGAEGVAPQAGAAPPTGQAPAESAPGAPPAAAPQPPATNPQP